KQPFIHLNTIFIASNIILHLFHYLAKPLLTVPNNGVIAEASAGLGCDFRVSNRAFITSGIDIAVFGVASSAFPPKFRLTSGLGFIF
ncbi:hypothetical protein, partial [Candidatus Cyrtobacter comes]|uniref:hypothetical protein n=1 Tax=Candidatus Cyrtobacter comes TaxID=675776 RepID=UPI002ACDF686